MKSTTSDYLNQLLALLRARTKFDFRGYREKMLARRLERRLGLSHFENLADFLARLREHPEEIKQLARELLISVTRFFRDPEAYRTLETEVLAPLMRAKVADTPFSRMDLISCRNLLIDLEPEVQRKVLALLHFALKPGGYLFLGPSETVGRQTDLFEPVSKKWRIFRRIGPSRADDLQFPVRRHCGLVRSDPGNWPSTRVTVKLASRPSLTPRPTVSSPSTVTAPSNRQTPRPNGCSVTPSPK